MTLNEAISEITANVQKIPPDVIKPFASIVKKIFSNTLYIVLGLLNLVVAPVFTFYFLRDFDLMKKRAAELIPLAYREWTLGKFRQVDETLGAFLRGQLTVCTMLAVLYSFGLMIVGIDMAVIIGVSAGYLFIVPYLGTIFGIITASIMALLKFHDFWHVLGVWVVFLVVQLFETYFLTPRIVGDRVGLNPVLVILALLIGGGLFGFLGILLAVPVAAVLKIFASDLVNYYQSTELYLGGVKSEGKKEVS
jgi:predicted PurR-regulated permease PerM